MCGARPAQRSWRLPIGNQNLITPAATERGVSAPDSPTEMSSLFSKAGLTKKRASLRKRRISALSEAMRFVRRACRNTPRTPVWASPSCSRSKSSRPMVARLESGEVLLTTSYGHVTPSRASVTLTIYTRPEGSSLPARGHAKGAIHRLDL